jgi:hypothetical protein
VNRKQRMQNRENARRLKRPEICPNCGEPGPHYIVDPAPFFGGDMSGWTCPKLYGPDGRRLPDPPAPEER